MTWLDWDGRDRGLEDHVAWLSGIRATYGLGDPAFLQSTDVQWMTECGTRLSEADWHDQERGWLEMRIGTLRIQFDRMRRSVTFLREEKP